MNRMVTVIQASVKETLVVTEGNAMFLVIDTPDGKPDFLVARPGEFLQVIKHRTFDMLMLHVPSGKRVLSLKGNDRLAPAQVTG